MLALLKAINDYVRSEIVVLTALVAAALDLLIAFGIPLSPLQKAAVISVASLVLALIARSQVTPAP